MPEQSNVLEAENAKKHVKKVDYWDLLAKYGKRPRRRRSRTPTVYAEKGFSIQFKLSTAYRALQKQERDVAQPDIKLQPRLPRRTVRLMARKERQKHNTDAGQHDVTDRHALTVDERLALDLNSYSELGRQRRINTEHVVLAQSLEKASAYLTPEMTSQTGNGDVKKRPASFWRHLMQGKSSSSFHFDEDSNDATDASKTFITQTGGQSSQRKHNEKKRSRRKRRSESREKEDDGASASLSGLRSRPTSACAEWDDRRHKRRATKRQQRLKLDTASRRSKPNSRNASPPPRPSSAAFTSATSASKRTRTQSSQSRASPAKTVQFALRARPRSAPVATNSQPLEARKDAHDDEEEESDEVEVAYRPSKFLYRLSNCKCVSRPTTITRLLRASSTVSGHLQLLVIATAP